MSVKTRWYFIGFLLWVLAFPACSTDESNIEPTDARDKFLGTWNVTENLKNQTYFVNITADASSGTGVYLSNFGNAGTGNKVHAIISGNSITLLPVNQMMENEWIVNGSGSYSGTNKINWSYTINTGADLLQITAIYTK